MTISEKNEKMAVQFFELYQMYCFIFADFGADC